MTEPALYKTKQGPERGPVVKSLNPAVFEQLEEKCLFIAKEEERCGLPHEEKSDWS